MSCGSKILVVFLLALLPYYGTIGTELFSNPGPENIFRKEGESSIFIPCPFFYGLSIPVWIINDATYGTQTLPDSYVAFADGLLVTIALRQLNGTTFQCYTEIGLEVFKSSIGTLFIELDGKAQNNTYPSSTTSLIMDYQRVLFTPENKTIAWAVINKEFCTNAPDDLIYQIQGFICPNRTVVDSWNLTDTTYTIRSDALGKAITYLNITVRNYHQNTDCGNLQNYLLISPNLITETVFTDPNGTVCLEVASNPFGDLFVLWPRNPAERDSFTRAKDLDCECPIFNFRPFEKCNCIKEQKTSYSVTFINNTVDIGSPNYTICWKNIDPLKQMNNTRIYFYTAAITCPGGIITDQHTRLKFHRAVNIVINGSPPDPPLLNVDGTNIYICSDDLSSNFSVEQYYVHIADVTGEHSQTNPIVITRNMTSNCTLYQNPIRHLQPQACTPFKVTIMAFSRDGFSNASEVMISDMDMRMKSNYCECMEKKVDINMRVVKTSQHELMVQINCSKILAAGNKTNITINLQNSRSTSDDQQKREIIQCNGTTQLVIFNDLNQNARYTILAFWNTLECQLSNKLQAKTELLPFPSTWFGFITPVGLIVLVVIACVIVLVGIFIYQVPCRQ